MCRYRGSSIVMGVGPEKMLQPPPPPIITKDKNK